VYLHKQRRTERVRAAHGEFSGRYDGRTWELRTGQFYRVVRVRGLEILCVVRILEGNRHEICKVKGITLNYKNSRIINFNNIRKLIIDNKRERHDEEEEEEMGEAAINLSFIAIRCTVFHEVVKRNETKTCAPVLIKRKFINNRFRMILGENNDFFFFFFLSLIF